MTNVQPDNAELRGSPGGPVPAKSTSSLRLVLLLMVFGVALIGLLYDYTVARPAIKRANQIVQDLLLQKIPDPNNDNTVTCDEVQQLLGREPTRIEQKANYMVEVYSWRAGFPTRTYDLKVVYSGRRLPLLYSAAANDEPEYPASTEMREPPTEEQAKNFTPPSVGGVGAGGGTMQRSAKAPPDGQEKAAPKPPTQQPPADEAAKEAPPADPASMNPPADPATPPADPATPPADPATPPADPAPADPAKDSGGSTA